MDMDEKPIPVDSLEDTDGLEGHYVTVPQFRFPIYIPRRDENGVPILPEDWHDEEDDNWKE